MATLFGQETQNGCPEHAHGSAPAPGADGGRAQPWGEVRGGRHAVAALRLLPISPIKGHTNEELRGGVAEQRALP